MNVFFTSLNSGSNGNCYYVGNDEEAVLVDAGLTCKETEHRMQLLGLDIKKVKGIFISHEHTDHIKGMISISEKHEIPIYITQLTASQTRLPYSKSIIKPFNKFEKIQIGNLSITAFPKFHDAIDPHSFIISCNQITIGVFTDIGRICSNVIHYFKQCSAAILEANYDQDLLEKGRYPAFLKNRIKGGSGHLSNTEAYTLVKEHKPEFMKQLLLGHLSKENNCPVKVRELFSQHTHPTEIIVASRWESTPLFTINTLLPNLPALPKFKNLSRQLSFFEV